MNDAAPHSRSRADHGELIATFQISRRFIGKTFHKNPPQWPDGWKDEASTPATGRFIEGRGEPSIDLLARVFEQAVARGDMALICGSATSSAHAVLGPGLLALPDVARRNGENFTDEPSTVFSIDVDKLPISAIDADFQPIADAARLPDLYLGLIERLGLEWLATDCVIRPSSSYGLRDDAVSFHVTHLLDRRLTLAAKQQIARAINDAAAADGIVNVKGDPICDERIYTPEHYLFVAPAKFVDHTGAELPSPTRHVPRVMVGRFGAARIELPAGLLSACEAAPAVRAGVRAKHGERRERGATGAALRSAPDSPAAYRRHELSAHRNKLLQAIRPGNTDAQVRDYAWSVALHDWHRPFTIQRHKASIAASILATYPADIAADKVSEHLASFDDKLHRAAVKLGRIFPATAPPRPLPTLTIDDARADVDLRMQVAIAAAEAHSTAGAADPPPVHVLSHVQGVGKSTAAASHLTVDRLRAFRIAYVAPTIELAEQRAAEHRALIVAELKARGMAEAEATAAAFALVRVHVGFKKTCGEESRKEISETVGRAGGSLIRLCEGDKRSGAAPCPYLASCPWPAQRRDTAKGIVYQAHANLVTSMKAMENEPDRAYDFTIIDESPMGVLLGGVRTIKIEDLERFLARDVFSMRGESIDQQAYLSELIALVKFNVGLSTFTPRLPFVPHDVKRLDDPETFAQPPIVAEDGTETAQPPITKLRCEWAADTFRKEIERQRRALMEDAFGCIGGEHGANKALGRAAARISTLETIARSFECIAMSARLGRPTVIGLQVYGETLKCHVANRLPETVLARPAIWLDASYRAEILSEIYRDRSHTLAVSGQGCIAAPYASVLQIAGTFARSSLMDGASRTECGPDGIEVTSDKRDNGARKLARIIAFHALRHARGPDCGVRDAVKDEYGNTIGERRVDVAVICQQSVEADLAKILAEYGITNVATRHFNAIRGLNDFARIPCLIVVGRPAPAIRDLEDMASAFFWRHPGLPAITRTGDIETSNSDRPAWMSPAQRAVLMSDGTGRSIEAERHPDPFAEAIRGCICDDEVVQAIFRGRPLSRTAASPLNIVYLGSGDPGLPVSELMPRDAYAIDVGDLMIAGGMGVGAPALITRGWGSMMQAGGRRLLEGLAPEFGERFQALSMSSCSGGRESAPGLNIDRGALLRPGADSSTPMQLILRAAEVTLAERGTGAVLAPATTFYLDADLTTDAAKAKIETRLACRVCLFRWLDPMPLLPPAPQPQRAEGPARHEPAAAAVPILPPPPPPTPPPQARGDRDMSAVQQKVDRPATRLRRLPPAAAGAQSRPTAKPEATEAAEPDYTLNPTLMAVFERMRHTPGRPNPWRLLSEQMDIEEKAERAARKAARKAAVAGGGAGAD